jgi:hypothetical protein
MGMWGVVGVGSGSRTPLFPDGEAAPNHAEVPWCMCLDRDSGGFMLGFPRDVKNRQDSATLQGDFKRKFQARF